MSAVIKRVLAATLLLLAAGSLVGAQSPRLKNIELCNGGTRASPDSPIRRSDRTSPELQIRGCTAFIELGNEKPYVLAIAHNNRGNAYRQKVTTTALLKITTNRSSSIQATPEHSTIEASCTSKRASTIEQ